MTRDTDI